MSCGDGSGHQLDTGFGVGWSNNLNEGTVLKTRILLVNRNHDSLVQNGWKEDIWGKHWEHLWAINFFIQVPNAISLFQALKLIYIFLNSDIPNNIQISMSYNVWTCWYYIYIVKLSLEYFTCELFGSHLIEYDCKSLSIISDVTLPRRSSKNEKNVLKNKLPKILDMLNRKRQGNIRNS